MAQRLRDLAKDVRLPRLVTLTLRSSSAPLGQQIARLRACWKRIKGRKFWKTHVVGGAFVIECTYNTSTDQWHPHAHIICEGAYMPQVKLAALWEEITADSAIVDVRAAHGKDAVARYVAKYVTKANAVPDAPASRICEWAAAIHGLRLYQPFGSWHNARPKDEEPTRVELTQQIGHVEPLLEAAERGDTEAVGLLRDLAAAKVGRIPNLATPAGERDAARNRELAASLRRWFCPFKGHNSDATAPNSTDRGPPGRPNHRPERLWKESDATPAQHW